MPEASDDPLTDIGSRGVAAHEINPVDRVASHRLVATAMIVVFLVTAISQGWWKHLRDFVNEKTHGPATKAPPGG